MVFLSSFIAGGDRFLDEGVPLRAVGRVADTLKPFRLRIIFIERVDLDAVRAVKFAVPVDGAV